jgi:hypothetical protein
MRILMKFKHLAKSITKTHKGYSDTLGERMHYPRVLEPGYDINKITLDDCERIFDFLNIWGKCRIKRNSSALLGRLKKTTAWIEPLRRIRIENCELDFIISVHRENLTLGHTIHYVFDELADIPDFGPVPASKTLHAIAPSFFIMWDNAIAKNYGCKLRGFDYAYKFLPKMKLEINECIQDVMSLKMIKREEAINYIMQYGNSIWRQRRPISKLVDEYNWINK